MNLGDFWKQAGILIQQSILRLKCGCVPWATDMLVSPSESMRYFSKKKKEKNKKKTNDGALLTIRVIRVVPEKAAFLLREANINATWFYIFLIFTSWKIMNKTSTKHTLEAKWPDVDSWGSLHYINQTLIYPRISSVFSLSARRHLRWLSYSIQWPHFWAMNELRAIRAMHELRWVLPYQENIHKIKDQKSTAEWQWGRLWHLKAHKLLKAQSEIKKPARGYRLVEIWWVAIHRNTALIPENTTHLLYISS